MLDGGIRSSLNDLIARRFLRICTALRYGWIWDRRSWERWWKDRLRTDLSHHLSLVEAPAVEYQGRLYDVANRDDLLIAIMAEQGLRTVLCAGNGVSQEPRALASAGFDVTALDVSRTAVEEAKASEHAFDLFRDHKANRPGGRVQFVVGNLFDPRVCSGPFDVIIERRTVQLFRGRKQAAALEALSERLSPVGIFLSHCNDDQFPPDLGWSYHSSGLFHASESWFRKRGWTIWDGAPNSRSTGRVAWLIRSGSMKPSPRGK